MALTNFTDGNALTEAQLDAMFWNVFSIEGLNMIRQLQDRSIDFSSGMIDGWAEAYIDADGRKNSVDTGNDTTSLFETNEYTSRKKALSTEAANFSTANSSQASMTMTITATVEGFISRLGSDTGGWDGSTAWTVEIKSGSTVLASINGSGAEDPFDLTLTSSDYTRAFTPSEVISIVFTRTGGTGNIQTKTGQTFSGSLFTMSSQEVFCDSANPEIEFSQVSADDPVIVHTIPSGTFGTAISSAIGVPLVDGWDVGANIQYKLTNTGGDDSGWLDAMNTSPEVSSFTAFSNGEPDTLTVKLIQKSSSPTAGYPSIKGFFVRAE